MKRTAADVKVVPLFNGFPIRLHFRNDLHLLRKAWHMIMGLLIVTIYMSGLSRSSAVWILGSFLGVDLLIESARLRSPSVNEKVLRFWGPFMRAHELQKMSTVPQYIAAAIIAIGVFPKPVAVLSLVYLACGDPLASLVGILYGQKGPRFAPGKTWAGTIAGVLVCGFATFFYMNTFALSDMNLFLITVIGALAGGTVELLPFDIDDNFTIPVISGFVLWLSFIVLGI